jgi:hypothetical protein
MKLMLLLCAIVGGQCDWQPEGAPPFVTLDACEILGRYMLVAHGGVWPHDPYNRPQYTVRDFRCDSE